MLHAGADVSSDRRRSTAAVSFPAMNVPAPLSPGRLQTLSNQHMASTASSTSASVARRRSHVQLAADDLPTPSLPLLTQGTLEPSPSPGKGLPVSQFKTYESLRKFAQHYSSNAPGMPRLKSPPTEGVHLPTLYKAEEQKAKQAKQMHRHKIHSTLLAESENREVSAYIGVDTTSSRSQKSRNVSSNVSKIADRRQEKNDFYNFLAGRMPTSTSGPSLSSLTARSVPSHGSHESNDGSSRRQQPNRRLLPIHGTKSSRQMQQQNHPKPPQTTRQPKQHRVNRFLDPDLREAIAGREALAFDGADGDTSSTAAPKEAVGFADGAAKGRKLVDFALTLAKHSLDSINLSQNQRTAREREAEEFRAMLEHRRNVIGGIHADGADFDDRLREMSEKMPPFSDLKIGHGRITKVALLPDEGDPGEGKPTTATTDGGGKPSLGGTLLTPISLVATKNEIMQNDNFDTASLNSSASDM